jgi:serine/threonine protein kinase
MLIAERYRSIRRLGKGLTGDVHLVEDTQTDTELSLKFLRIDHSGHDPADLLESFKKEFSILKELHHPHIARIADFGSEPDVGHYFFTEEYI